MKSKGGEEMIKKINPRHTKVLTKEEVSYLKSKYDVRLDKDNVHVALNYRNQITTHHISNPVSLRCANRRVIINALALKLWKQLMKIPEFENNYNVFDVVYATSLLIVKGEIVNVENVITLLKETEKEKN
jgi:hypothetical protein